MHPYSSIAAIAAAAALIAGGSAASPAMASVTSAAPSASSQPSTPASTAATSPTPHAKGAAKSGPTAQAESDSPIVINEVESNGDAVGDWVEIANTSDSSTDIDVSDYTLVDNDPDHNPVTLSALKKVDESKDLELESGEYLALYTDDGFGLGGDDSVTLADANGDQVDTTSWMEHAATTWGRIPDTTGDFAVTGKPTPNAANVADGGDDDRPTRDWPYPVGDVSNALPDVDLGEDSSGVDFDGAGNAYLVNNGTGALFKLNYDTAKEQYAITDVWDLNYTDGKGTPDAEGVTVTDEGTVYVGTERNDDNDDVSRPSVLEFDVPASGGTADDPQALDAKQEWNLKSDVGTVGANAGIEAVEWLPDVMGGVFAVGVEGTADVLFEKLNADGTFALQQRWKSPTKGVMALDYQPSTGELLVVADEADSGYSVSLTFAGTKVKTPTDDAGDIVLNKRPEALGDFANEGFARYISTEECTTGTGSVTSYRYLWADDNDTDGTGLRQSTATEGTCASASPSESPSESASPSDSTAPSATETTREAAPSSSAPAPGGGSGDNPDDDSHDGSGDDGSGDDGSGDAAGELPETGAHVAATGAIGLLLIVGGAATTLLGRRRRT